MKSKKVVCRKCTGCGLVVERDKLIKIVKDREGMLSLDESGNGKGRGAYICLNEECIEKAYKRNGLERSFRSGISEEKKTKLFKEIKEFERRKSGCTSGNGD